MNLLRYLILVLLYSLALVENLAFSAPKNSFLTCQAALKMELLETAPHLALALQNLRINHMAKGTLTLEVEKYYRAIESLEDKIITAESNEDFEIAKEQVGYLSNMRASLEDHFFSMEEHDDALRKHQADNYTQFLFSENITEILEKYLISPGNQPFQFLYNKEFKVRLPEVEVHQENTELKVKFLPARIMTQNDKSIIGFKIALDMDHENLSTVLMGLSHLLYFEYNQYNKNALALGAEKIFIGASLEAVVMNTTDNDDPKKNRRLLILSFKNGMVVEQDIYALLATMITFGDLKLTSE